MKILKLSICLIFFGLSAYLHGQAPTTLERVPYGLGVMIMDNNTKLLLPQNEEYLTIPSPNFVKPHYTGDMDSDKYLFEQAVKLWMKTYQKEYEAYMKTSHQLSPNEEK